MIRIVFASVLTLLLSISYAQDNYYRVQLLRAAPGDLLSVIDEIKTDMRAYKQYGIQKPYLIRHSQGDHWDLMLIYPISKPSEYFSEVSQNKIKLSKTLEKSYGDPFFEKVSFQEESIVWGPDHKRFNRWMEKYGYFHIEIFTSLAGKQKELLKEREMENLYLIEIDRRPNFVFTKVMGASWDIFTLGCYDGLKDFASSADIPIEKEDAAAKKAGFESVYTIGSYLRSLILEHHDTLGGKVDVD